MNSVDSLIAPIIVVLADVIVFVIFGRMGKKSSGTGSKYEPFTGGERDVPARGLYQSNLFVFASLFLIVEAFALILAGSFLSPDVFYPVLFLVGGSGVLTLVVWWLMLVGGGKF